MKFEKSETLKDAAVFGVYEAEVRGSGLGVQGANSLADVLRAEPLWAEALSSEPRLDLAPVDIRSGSRG